MTRDARLDNQPISASLAFLFGQIANGIDKVASGSEQVTCVSVGLKILKNKLSEYVRLATGGETVLITDRDRVVAEIVLPQPGRSALLADARLAEAVREGWVSPSAARWQRKPVMTSRDLMQDLQRDREDR